MQHFFAQKEQIDELHHEIHILGPDVRHIRNVLRMRIGEELWVSDGEKKEYHCEIASFEADEILLKILYAQEPEYELPSRIYLFQGLPKSDKMDLIVQKAVELGVYRIVPVATSRSVLKLDKNKEAKKLARWQQIAQSAAEQSRRMLVPEVSEVKKFDQAVELAKSLDVVLVPYELAEGMGKTREIIRNIRPGQSVGIFIGPEGGFEEREVELAIKAGAEAITLGHRILRTETAGLTALSILMFQLEGES